MDKEQLRAVEVCNHPGAGARVPPATALQGEAALDPTRRAFIEKHGDDSVYELDALTPAQLASLLEEAILDVDRHRCLREASSAQEERDLEAIAQLKRQILK